MKNLKETNKNTLTVTAEFNMVEQYETLVSNGMAGEDALKTVNDIVKKDAFGYIVNKAGVNWQQLINGVIYEQLTEDLQVDIKPLKVSDIFILKTNKNSYKVVIPADLFTFVESFAVNILDAEITALNDETLAKLHIYTKYMPNLECFKCETRTSNNMLEKQFQELLNYFYSNDTTKAPQAKKTYIKHLAKMYLKANKNGYKAGNAINMLQLIIDHAYDCKIGKQYEVKSGLASHKAPKENKKA